MMKHLLTCLVVLRGEGSRLEECKEDHGESVVRCKFQPALGLCYEPGSGVGEYFIDSDFH